jgi:hypothetical protein
VDIHIGYNEPFTVNVSEIQDYMKCRWRWCAKWVVGRVPRDEARPLRFGKLLHQVFEHHFVTQQPMSVAVEMYEKRWQQFANEATDPRDTQVALDAIEDLGKYREPLSHWTDRYPTEGMPLEVEKAFIVKSPIDPTIFIKGRPDRMQMMWGQLFHWQNRGLAAGTNFPLYAEIAKRNMHEHVYAYAMKEKYPNIPYGGTVYNLLRKLKYRGVPTKKDPEGKILHTIDEMFWQGLVTITPELNTEMMEIVTRYAQEMRFARMLYDQDRVWPLPNETIHGGIYGNSMDPYFRVLNGEVGLDSETLFKDREDTYVAQEIAPA